MAHRRARTEAGHHWKEENDVTKSEIKVRKISVRARDVFCMDGYSGVVVVRIEADGRAVCRNTRTGRSVKIRIARLQNEYRREGTTLARRALKKLAALDKAAQK